MKANKISRTKAVEMIEGSKGKFFTATFTKKNGEERTINCNWRKGAKTALGYLRVYSMTDKSYKSINPQTMTALSFAGQKMTVK